MLVQRYDLEVDKLEELALTLTDYIIENKLDLSSKSSLVLDEELDLEELTLDTLKSFEKLAPYGMDNKSLYSTSETFRWNQQEPWGRIMPI